MPRPLSPIAAAQNRAFLAAPIRKSEQQDGRVRYWGAVSLPDEGEERILRVVTLEDGETVHNAFFDRNFREGRP